MASKTQPFDLKIHHKKYLAPLIPTAPFVLRITEWKDQPVPVLVVKERLGAGGEEGESGADKDPQAGGRTRLSEVGFIAGESQRLCLPIFRRIIEKVKDRSGIPLEMQRYLTVEGLRLRINLPLDEDAGAKLGLISRLQMRVKEPDRVELIARRVARFTGEEASYWLSRTTHFGPDANRWALSGLRIVLGGQPKDPAVQKMLERLRLGA
jgi:hypothetical protein